MLEVRGLLTSEADEGMDDVETYLDVGRLLESWINIINMLFDSTHKNGTCMIKFIQIFNSTFIYFYMII